MNRQANSIVVIINEDAGPERNPELLSDQVRGLFAAHSLGPEILNVRRNKLGPAIEAAIDRKPEIIAAAGGDGTVSLVANKLARTDITLGVLPTGTLNHFALDCGITRNLDTAVACIAQGKERCLDLGEVNGMRFINNSSLGLYPQAVRLRDVLTSRLGGNKWAAMAIACLQIFARFPLYDVCLDVDNESHNLKTPMVFVGNNQYSLDVLTLGRRKTMSSGSLHLLTSESEGRFGLLKLAWRSLINRFNDTDIHHRLVPRLTIRTPRKRIYLSLDGEVRKCPTPVHYRILPGALRVLAPPVKE